MVPTLELDTAGDQVKVKAELGPTGVIIMVPLEFPQEVLDTITELSSIGLLQLLCPYRFSVHPKNNRKSVCLKVMINR